MSLLQNISLINQYPVRYGSYHGTKERSMWGNKLETNLNRYAGMAGLYAGDAIPRGYYFPYTWAPSRFAGGMSSYGRVEGEGSISPLNLAGGKYIILLGGTLVGSGAVASNIRAEAWIRADYPKILGVGALVSDITGGFPLQAIITGSSTFVSVVNGIGVISSNIDGLGDVAPLNLIGGLNAVASILGAGGVDADILGFGELQAAIAGLSSVDADIVGSILAIANLSGTSTASGNITGVGKIGSSISGLGEISDANMSVLAYISALLAGSGQVSWADIAGGMYISANLSGDSLVVSYLSGVGWMTATINIGAKPSAYDIAGAVWSAIAAQYDTPGTMGKKLNDAGSAGDPWSTLKAPYNDPATFGGFVKKLLTLAKYLGLKD